MPSRPRLPRRLGSALTLALTLTLTLTRTLTLTLTQRADPNQAVPLSHVPQGALADHVPQAPSP